MCWPKHGPRDFDNPTTPDDARANIVLPLEQLTSSPIQRSLKQVKTSVCPLAKQVTIVVSPCLLIAVFAETEISGQPKTSATKVTTSSFIMPTTHTVKNSLNDSCNSSP